MALNPYTLAAMNDIGYTSMDDPMREAIRRRLDAEAARRAAPLKRQNDRRAAESALRQEMLKKINGQMEGQANTAAARFRRAVPPGVPFEGAGSTTAEGMARRELGNQMALTPGGSDRLRRMQILNAGTSRVDPYADAPEDVARKEAMNKMVGVGAALGAPGRFVTPGEDIGTDEMARIRAQKAMESRKSQSERARIIAGKMESGELPPRPTRQSQNEARFNARLERMRRLQEAQMAPILSAIQAQKGLSPLDQAHANLLQAQADILRGQIGQANGQPAPGAQPPPGAPQGQGGQQIPPGAPAPAPPGFWDVHPNPGFLLPNRPGVRKLRPRRDGGFGLEELTPNPTPIVGF